MEFVIICIYVCVYMEIHFGKLIYLNSKDISYMEI